MPDRAAKELAKEPGRDDRQESDLEQQDPETDQARSSPRSGRRARLPRQAHDQRGQPDGEQQRRADDASNRHEDERNADDDERQNHERHEAQANHARNRAPINRPRPIFSSRATVSCLGRTSRNNQPATFQINQIGRTTKRKNLRANMPRVSRKNTPASSIAPNDQHEEDRQAEEEQHEQHGHREHAQHREDRQADDLEDHGDREQHAEPNEGLECPPNGGEADDEAVMVAIMAGVDGGRWSGRIVNVR